MLRSKNFGLVLILGLALVGVIAIYQWQSGGRAFSMGLLGPSGPTVERVGGKWMRFRPSDLQAGDQILAINGIEVHNVAEAKKVLEALYQPGADKLSVLVRRKDDSGRWETRTVDLDRNRIASIEFAGGGKTNIGSYKPSADGLYAAAESGNATAVEQILDAGGVRFVNDLVRGQTALSIAVSKGNMEVVRVLLDHKADPNKMNVDQTTPLMRAAEIGNADLVAALMVSGADTSIRNSQLQTASDIADSQGFLDVSSFIDNPSPTKFLTADQKRKIADPLRDMGLLKSSGYRPSDEELSVAIKGYQRQANLPVSGILTAETFGDLLRFAKHYAGSKNDEAISQTTQKTLSRIFARELADAWTPISSSGAYPKCDDESVNFTISPDQRTITWKSYRPGLSAGAGAPNTPPTQTASFKVKWADQKDGYDTIFVQPDPRPIVGPAYQKWEIRDGTIRISAQSKFVDNTPADTSPLADLNGPPIPKDGDSAYGDRGQGDDAASNSPSEDGAARVSFLASCHS